MNLVVYVRFFVRRVRSIAEGRAHGGGYARLSVENVRDLMKVFACKKGVCKT